MERLPYVDRRSAGEELGRQLAGAGLSHPLVLALPRGGVVVAAAVADALGGDLDVLLVRKIGHPRRPELALGAVAEDGVPVFDEEGLRLAGLTPADLEPVVLAERAECRRRVAAYRGDRPPPAAAGRAAVVVDDGVATGMTALAALRHLRNSGATRLVFAAPVAAPDALRRLQAVADDVVVPWVPRDFGAVSRFYLRFDQTTDDEVVALLRLHDRDDRAAT